LALPRRRFRGVPWRGVFLPWQAAFAGRLGAAAACPGGALLLAGWLAGCLAGWLPDWLAGWLLLVVL